MTPNETLDKAIARLRLFRTGVSNRLTAEENAAFDTIFAALRVSLPQGEECDCDGGEQGEGLMSIPHEPHCATLQSAAPAVAQTQEQKQNALADVLVALRNRRLELTRSEHAIAYAGMRIAELNDIIAMLEAWQDAAPVPAAPRAEGIDTLEDQVVAVKLRDLIAALRAASAPVEDGWQPISTAPRNTRVLVFTLFPKGVGAQTRLKEGLDRFGQHDATCAIWVGPARHNACTCGLDALLTDSDHATQTPEG